MCFSLINYNNIKTISELYRPIMKYTFGRYKISIGFLPNTKINGIIILDKKFYLILLYNLLFILL